MPERSRMPPIRRRNQRDCSSSTARCTVADRYPACRPKRSSDPNSALGGTQDNGPQLYSGQLSWSNLVGCDGGWAAFDSALASTAHFTCQGDLLSENAAIF